jgi:hypothetical protein
MPEMEMLYGSIQAIRPRACLYGDLWAVTWMIEIKHIGDSCVRHYVA